MIKKLHILFLSGWYPSRVNPANGDFVQRHAEAIATLHKVTIIHLVTDDNIKQKETTFTKIKDVHTHIIYIPKTKNLIKKLYVFIKTYIVSIKKIDNFDIIHVNITYPVGIVALILKWFKNIPYIISEHSTKYQPLRNIKIGKIEKIITQNIIKNASFVCPVSTDLKNKMIELGFLGNYFPIPNVVNTSIFNPSKGNLKDFTITHISHLRDNHKNISGILNVISKINTKIPNLKFVLVGKDAINYTKQVEDLKIISRTEFIDEVTNNEIPTILQRTNILVIFSNYENLPCVIIESFSCGIPVISTNVGGISEYFPKEFGLLINVKDELALENSILKVYNGEITTNQELMHRYADTYFGVQAICKQFSKLYFITINE